MLNGDHFRAWASGDKTVWAEKLPGKNLWERLEQGTLTRRMVKAAGHEFRRVHQFRSDEFRGPWSHGDAGTNNVIYDEKTGRARLIDFEIVHDKSLPPKSRQADDLEDELALPNGMAWIWWGVRTNFENPAKVKRRLEKIQDVIANLEFYRAFAARRARHRRRPSISCQVIRPGIPIPSSRTRAIKERAKAVGPSIPRRPPIRT